MDAYFSPLRYPGGKARLTNYIGKLMEINGLAGSCYAEPYAGGAGIAMSLLLTKKVKQIFLNDLNKSVHSFWYSVLHQPDDMCRMIKDTPVNMEQWYKQQAIQANPEDHNYLELGFSTFFLNRTNRSGIIHNSGVIGGKNQDGKWKIDARYNKESLINRIEKIASFASKIALSNLDAVEFITDVLPDAPKRTLVYFDPPYYVKGQGLYQNHYVHEDHKKISKLIKTKVKQYWIISYDNAPEIKELYRNLEQLEFSLNYSAKNYYKGTEVMIFRNGIKIPEEENPLRVAA
jgi:DNA adenine methylase